MIEVDTLRELLAYSPDTGILSWRIGQGHVMAGSAAGGRDSYGYLRVKVRGKFYKAHRIAWAITHGAWPVGKIDHRDGIRDNNRIANLRDVSNTTNMQNLKRAHIDNLSGSAVPGVCWRKRDEIFAARAKIGGVDIHIGHFATLAEAELASIEYRRKNYDGNTL